MPIIDLADLDLARLSKLEADRTPEDRSLEYKREISSSKELAKDISAFANGRGGLILFGIDEIDGKPRVVGIDPAGSTEKVDNVAADALSPRVNVLTKLVELEDDNRAVLAVWVAESDQKPHMVSAYGDQRYYVRRNTTNIPMNEVEVQDAYDIRKKAEAYADDLERKIFTSRRATQFPEYAWASLISVPRLLRDDMVPINEETQSWLTDQRAALLQLLSGYPVVGPRGFEIYIENENVPQSRYTVVGREGYVETTVMMDIHRRNSLASRGLMLVAMEFLTFCGLMYDRASYNGIVGISLGVDHIGELRLALDRAKHPYDSAPKLQASEVHFHRNESAASLRTAGNRICKMFMDRVYQSAGLMSCDYFNSDGEIIP